MTEKENIAWSKVWIWKIAVPCFDTVPYDSRFQLFLKCLNYGHSFLAFVCSTDSNNIWLHCTMVFTFYTEWQGRRTEGCSHRSHPCFQIISHNSMGPSSTLKSWKIMEVFPLLPSCIYFLTIQHTVLKNLHISLPTLRC